MTYSVDAQVEANHNRRMANQARIDYAKLDRRDAAADALIGILQGEAGRRFYINCRTMDGKLTGKIREFKTRSEAADFLLRNRYV